MDYRAEARRILQLIRSQDAETAMSLAIKHWWETSYEAGRLSVQAIMIQTPPPHHATVQQEIFREETTVNERGSISAAALEAMRKNPNLPWKLPGNKSVDEVVKEQMEAGGQSVVQDNSGIGPVGNQGEPTGLERSAVGSGHHGGMPIVPQIGGNGASPVQGEIGGNAVLPPNAGAMNDINAQGAAENGSNPVAGLPVTKQGSY